MRQGIALATSVVTLAGMWLAGSGSWKGWALGLANQALWLTFIIVFDAWGLLPLCVALVFVYTRNLVRWRSRSLVSADELMAEIVSGAQLHRST